MGTALLVVLILYLLLGLVIVFNDFRTVYYNRPMYVTEKKYLFIPRRYCNPAIYQQQGSILKKFHYHGLHP